MSAFENAWLTLKAQPGAQGIYGTVHPAIAGVASNEFDDEYLGDSALSHERDNEAVRIMNPVARMRGGMLNRLQGKDLEMLDLDQRARLEGMTDNFSGRGDVVHRDIPRLGESIVNDKGKVVEHTSMPQIANVPVPLANLGGGKGEEFPMGVSAIERDTSPLRENVTSMMGTARRNMQGDIIHPTQSIPMLETDPEESFTTPIERARAGQDMTSAANRMITGSRGGRMDMTGGGRSGTNMINLGMQTDNMNRLEELEGKTSRGKPRFRRNQFARERKDTKLGNVEGIRSGRGDRLSSMTNRFVKPEEEEEAPQEMTQDERVAAILAGMTTPGGSKIADEVPEPTKPKPVARQMFTPRMTGARRIGMDDAQRVPLTQDEKMQMLNAVPPIGAFTDDDAALASMMTNQAFAEPSSAAAQQFARQQLMQAAINMGRKDGSKAQGAIDRAA